MFKIKIINGMDSDLIIALNDFLEMRKQSKSKMTDRAIKLMLNKLDELASNDTDKICRIS